MDVDRDCRRFRFRLDAMRNLSHSLSYFHILRLNGPVLASRDHRQPTITWFLSDLDSPTQASQLAMPCGIALLRMPTKNEELATLDVGDVQSLLQPKWMY